LTLLYRRITLTALCRHVQWLNAGGNYIRPIMIDRQALSTVLKVSIIIPVFGGYSIGYFWSGIGLTRVTDANTRHGRVDCGWIS